MIGILNNQDFPAQYQLLKPVPVEIEQFGGRSYVATFKEANISMTGTDPQNAKDELADTIIDFFETFRDDPKFKDDLNIVRSYISEVPAQ